MEGVSGVRLILGPVCTSQVVYTQDKVHTVHDCGHIASLTRKGTWTPTWKHSEDFSMSNLAAIMALFKCPPTTLSSVQLSLPFCMRSNVKGTAHLDAFGKDPFIMYTPFIGSLPQFTRFIIHISTL